MSWADFEEKYCESKNDFPEYDEPELSWEEAEAEAAGVPLFGPI